MKTATIPDGFGVTNGYPLIVVLCEACETPAVKIERGKGYCAEHRYKPLCHDGLHFGPFIANRNIEAGEGEYGVCLECGGKLEKVLTVKGVEYVPDDRPQRTDITDETPGEYKT